MRTNVLLERIVSLTDKVKDDNIEDLDIKMIKDVMGVVKGKCPHLFEELTPIHNIIVGYGKYKQGAVTQEELLATILTLRSVAEGGEASPKDFYGEFFNVGKRLLILGLELSIIIMKRR